VGVAGLGGYLLFKVCKPKLVKEQTCHASGRVPPKGMTEKKGSARQTSQLDIHPTIHPTSTPLSRSKVLD